MRIFKLAVFGMSLTCVAFGSHGMQASAQAPSNGSNAAPNCPVNHDQLASALRKSVKPAGGPDNGGLENNEWAAVVTRDGTVCAVAFSGKNWGDQWLGSRVIAAEKANTANAFSVDKMALSTANLYSGAQPGGFLFGIGQTEPAAADEIASGAADTFGNNTDPLVGKRLGGVVVFGGGLGLYGDTGLYDIGLTGSSASGYGHPKCKGHEAEIAAKIGAGVSEGILH